MTNNQAALIAAGLAALLDEFDESDAALKGAR
jgi:hypothetical protein